MSKPNNVTRLTLDQAQTCALQAIELLRAQQLAPTPVNYAVCYEYHAGTEGELHNILDGHLKSGKSLDDYLLAELYERFLATDQISQFHGMRNDLQGILQNLMQTIGSADSQADAYRQSLEHNIGRLDDDKNANAIHAVATDLLEAAVTAKQNNEALQRKLQSSRQEAEQLRKELDEQRREALIDPLTGLFNRRALNQHLESLWSEAPDSAPLATVVIDIDHFKRINDTYGHAVGDVVIRHVADTMRKCIRGEDLAVRYGGEEFLVLLPGTPLAGAVKVAETIRTRIETLRLTRRHDNLTLDPFTISLGVAVRKPEDSQESLFERADQALYQSKSSGRNRVTVSELLQPEVLH